MEKITHKDISLQSVKKISSPLSPKRPRTDCTNSGKSRFDVPELLMFRKTVGSPSLTRTLQKNAGLICTAEDGDMQDEKPYEQQKDSKLKVTLITKVSTSHTDNRHTGPSAERHFLHLEKDEKPSVTETDKLSSYSADDAGGVLAKCHTPKDSGADTSSHPDYQWQGKSLEDGPPGGCRLPSASNEDRRQVQNSVNPIQAATLISGDEEVRCQCDYTYEDAWSQSAEVEESNQKGDEHRFSKNILFSEEEKEGKSLISASDYGVSKSFCSNREEDPSGNLAEGGKNFEKISELQIRENENVAVCDGATKEQVHENGMSENPISSAARSTEGSVVSHDGVLARNIAIETASLEVDDFCGANGEHAAGEMIAKAGSEAADHTTETPMPARISQEPAEGDNDAGSLSVIDPAIWNETDRHAEEKCCNSESTAGVELSVKVCEMETPPSLYSDVRPLQKISNSEQFYDQSRTQQCKDERDDLCQSYTEPPSYSITTNETRGMTGDGGSCRWESSPSSVPHRPTKPLPAGDERQEILGTVGHQLKEQDQSGCFSVGLDPLKTQQVGYSQTGNVRMDMTTEIKGREEPSSFEDEIITNRKEKLFQQNEDEEDTTKISTVDNITDWIEGEISTCDNILTLCFEDELGERLECLFDHPYSADISMLEETTWEKESVEEAIESVSEEALMHQNEHKADMAEISPDKHIGEEAQGNELTPSSGDEEGNKLSYFEYQLKTETFTVGNKDDILAFSDAVVPGPYDLSQRCHSQITDNHTAPNYNDTFPLVPSAFTLYDRVPEGFDTFDDGDAGPLLTSLPGQLLKTPQQQLYNSITESDEHEKIPEKEEEEEELERFELHTENLAIGFLTSDTNCSELGGFFSEADVIAVGRPEQQPNCESDSCKHIDEDLNLPPGSERPVTDVNKGTKFEMKKQFDTVLKELKLYFDISISDFVGDSRELSPVQCGHIAAACKEHLSSPELRRHKDTSSDEADEDRSLEMCGGDPVVSCIAGSRDGEQEVPFGNHLCQEASAEKHREPQETEQKRKPWGPSFMCPPLLEQLNHRQTRRLEPLRTCTRPIRVGLSKRARTKHLHRPHPYK
ncbi:hypothetical protein PAMP_014461 [Pampus punctatissimus]